MTDEQLSEIESKAHAAINKMADCAQWSVLVGQMHRDDYIECAVDHVESASPEAVIAMVAEIRRLRGAK